MEKRKQYAIGQHDLCCEHLGIGNSHEDRCDTLFEAVLALQDDLTKFKERAAGLETLAGELITMFRVNVQRGNINLKDAELDTHLTPWIQRLQKLKQIKTLGNMPKAWFEASAKIEADSIIVGNRSEPTHPYPQKYSVCDGCNKRVEVTFGGSHSDCSYVYGRRGWRQLGSYDG